MEINKKRIINYQWLVEAKDFNRNDWCSSCINIGLGDCPSKRGRKKKKSNLTI
jgi:hypothetical protein